MDRQTLRDWVHRFNAQGPEGLIDREACGEAPKRNAAQKVQLGDVVVEGPIHDAKQLAWFRRNVRMGQTQPAITTKCQDFCAGWDLWEGQVICEKSDEVGFANLGQVAPGVAEVEGVAPACRRHR